MDNQPNHQGNQPQENQPNPQENLPQNQPSQPTEIVKEPEKKLGRPPVDAERALQKLIEVFEIGASVTQACSFAGISVRTFYTLMEQDDYFRREVESARYSVHLEAKRNISKEIKGNKDLDTSKWFLEKYDKDANVPVVQANTQVNIFENIRRKFVKDETIHEVQTQETAPAGEERPSES